MRGLILHLTFILTTFLTTFSPSLANEVSGGDVSGHWTLDQSPYVIKGDIAIPQFDTLTIDPGVEVRFDGLYGLKATGTLRAVGTKNQMIVFWGP